MKVSNYLLTDLLIAELSCPLNKAHLEVFDSELRGFYVDVLSSGRKSFRLRYRFEKSLRVITLGDAKVLTSAQARQMVIKVLQQVRHGIDPSLPTASLDGLLLRDFLCEKYLPYVQSYKRSWKSDESMIRNHSPPSMVLL